MSAERCRAAGLHRRHHLHLVEAHMAGIGLGARRAPGREDIRDLQRRDGHGRGPGGRRGRASGLLGRCEAASRLSGLSIGAIMPGRGHVCSVLEVYSSITESAWITPIVPRSSRRSRAVPQPPARPPPLFFILLSRSPSVEAAAPAGGWSSACRACGRETARFPPPACPRPNSCRVTFTISSQQIEGVGRQHDVAVLAAFRLLIDE